MLVNKFAIHLQTMLYLKAFQWTNAYRINEFIEKRAFSVKALFYMNTGGVREGNELPGTWKRFCQEGDELRRKRL